MTFEFGFVIHSCFTDFIQYNEGLRIPSGILLNDSHIANL